MLMSSLDTWLANVEAEFWKAHGEVMNATGFQKVLDAFAGSSNASDSPSLLLRIREDAIDFYRAVNWSEPFLRYLAVFHMLTWAVVFYVTRGPVSDERLIAVCVVLTVMVLAGMPLNGVGSRYAASLFTEPDANYFSEDGIFVAVVYMVPLILLIVCLQIRMACRVVKLMVQVKRAQVKRKLRREAKSKTSASEAEPPTETKKEQ